MPSVFSVPLLYAGIQKFGFSTTKYSYSLVNFIQFYTLEMQYDLWMILKIYEIKGINEIVLFPSYRRTTETDALGLIELETFLSRFFSLKTKFLLPLLL